MTESLLKTNDLAGKFWKIFAGSEESGPLTPCTEAERGQQTSVTENAQTTKTLKHCADKEWSYGAALPLSDLKWNSAFFRADSAARSYAMIKFCWLDPHASAIIRPARSI